MTLVSVSFSLLNSLLSLSKLVEEGHGYLSLVVSQGVRYTLRQRLTLVFVSMFFSIDL
jgi:hypothetical protein